MDSGEMNRLCACVAAVNVMALCPLFGGNSFRVTPYVQHPQAHAMTVMWLAQEEGPAEIECWREGADRTNRLAAVARKDLSANVTGRRFVEDDRLEYCPAPELGYDCSGLASDNVRDRCGAWTMPFTVPCQYRVRLTGLLPDSVYRYRVRLEGGASYANAFRTPPAEDKWRGFRFVYYSDSETEPRDNLEDGGCTDDWTDPKTGRNRRYYATQTAAYAANVRAVRDFGAELIVMAGDLAQKGSRQCDWDEFWRHNAGPLNDPAGSIPIIASPGNHDYWDYGDGGQTAIAKYLSYFEYEPNGADVGVRQRELFHRVDYGPAAFLFLDACNGNDAVMGEDTSRFLHRTDADGTSGGCLAPDFNPGSAQYRWLEAQLKNAQRNRAFTFVISHQCPYSCGKHGGEIGEVNEREDPDPQSGRALRVLTPLFHRYGVDGWFCGHDEMMERSEVRGIEVWPDGTETPHAFSVWDMGIAGDGLRGNEIHPNPYERYRAHVNCPEIYREGVLVEGGKHYGHLQVTIDRTADGRWRATFDPVYLLFCKDGDGRVSFGGVRHYADRVVRLSSRFARSCGLKKVD